MSPRVLVHCTNLSISLDSVPLSKSLNLSLSSGDLICLMGGNGCGKSTLLEFIRRRSEGDTARPEFGPVIDGSLHLATNLRCRYLPQTIPVDVTPLTGLPPESKALVCRLASDFGLTGPDRPDGHFSQGELQKLMLAQALADDAELLLLDEPTNYLDIVGLTALEYHLDRSCARGAGVLIVSHDRALADRCADETILMTRERCYRVPGGATEVLGEREEDVKSRAKQAAQIRRRIRALQDDVQRKTTWAYRKEQSKKGAGSEKPFIAKRAAKMNKRAKAMERTAEKETKKLERTKPFVPKRVNLLPPSRTVRNRRVFLLNDVSFGYGDDMTLLHDLSFGASTNDKFCLMGANGAGKSTLLKLATGTLRPRIGVVEHNQSVSLAEIPQQLDTFYTKPTLLDNFADCPAPETEVRRALGAVQLRRDKVHEPIGAFSRGELMRAAIVKCLLQQAEFIILDEPTSHLDIESIQVFEQVLAEYDGGYLIVSHDRAFVEHVADQLYVLESGTLKLA